MEKAVLVVAPLAISLLTIPARPTAPVQVVSCISATASVNQSATVTQ